MKTQAITLAPSVNFKNLIEPENSNYSHKQEVYAKEIRNILNKSCSEDKKGRSWINYFKEHFGKDFLLKPGDKRNRLDVYVADNTGIYDIVATCSPTNKPSEEIFSEYADFTKTEIKQANLDFLTKLTMFILCTGMLIGIAAKKNDPRIASNSVNTELRTKALHSLSTDTVQLTSKMIKR